MFRLFCVLPICLIQFPAVTFAEADTKTELRALAGTSRAKMECMADIIRPLTNSLEIFHEVMITTHSPHVRHDMMHSQFVTAQHTCGAWSASPSDNRKSKYGHIEVEWEPGTRQGRFRVGPQNEFYGCSAVAQYAWRVISRDNTLCSQAFGTSLRHMEWELSCSSENTTNMASIICN
jgi:hypothetical protein